MMHFKTFMQAGNQNFKANLVASCRLLALISSFKLVENRENNDWRNNVPVPKDSKNASCQTQHILLSVKDGMAARDFEEYQIECLRLLLRTCGCLKKSQNASSKYN